MDNIFYSRMKYCLFLLLLLFSVVSLRAQDIPRWSVAFWNVENFFDTKDDTLKADEAFTPQGDNHWTSKRYADKRDKIYKVVAAMGWPAVMGMAEVENDWVLKDLCYFTPLRKFKYEFVHFDSPDERGIDCALIYRSDLFKGTEARPIGGSDSAEAFFTRDILMVGGVLTDKQGTDTCFFFVNHWPSKLGGAVADRHRIEIGQRLMAIMDSVQQAHTGALVLAMGDFNASLEEESVRKGLGFDGVSTNDQGFCNLMFQIPKGSGSYKYHDTWSCIDQMIANRDLEVEIFARDYLLTDDPKYLGKKLNRTYVGLHYQGGFSDHLPLITHIP